jgi:hypothetical protein
MVGNQVNPLIGIWTVRRRTSSEDQGKFNPFSGACLKNDRSEKQKCVDCFENFDKMCDIRP